MSQQINLYNASLRLQRDWLSLPMVAGGTLAAIALSLSASAYTAWEKGRLETEKAAVTSQLDALKQQTLELGKTLESRKSDPALEKEAEMLSAALARRQEVMQVLDQGSGAAAGFAEYLRGFARQSMDGVWLTGINIGDGDLEIRGRLIDPSLLPNYIRRLNTEPAFRGRRFAEVVLREVLPEKADTSAPGNAAVEPAGAASRPQRQPGRYVEFALQGTSSSKSLMSTGN